MTKGGDQRAALHPPRRPARPLETHESLKILRDSREAPTSGGKRAHGLFSVDQGLPVT